MTRKEIIGGGVAGFCFGCGQSNPIGLKLKFFLEDNNQIVTEFTPTKWHSGWKNVTHGGIICAILDEAMGWTVTNVLKIKSVTKELKINFKRPLFINKEITVRCRVINDDKKVIKLLAEAANEEGDICATADAIYVILDKDKLKEIMQ
ncbi:MAG: PaaI family thioesterase [archaeon]|nr:PaaI family thioesterase [archaeon]